MRIAVLGLGPRGRIYGGKTKRLGAEIVAVCDLKQELLQRVGAAWGVPENMRFTRDSDLFALGKIADVMIIATQDRDHYAHAMRAMEAGYDLLLEKPLDPDFEKCVEMAEYAEKHGRKVLVCHVLRYSPFYRRVKSLLDSGAIGELKEIRHSENVGYWHFSHSYVRGLWRREDETSPVILAKCCHDMDLLYWFAGANAKSVSSRGSLSYFTSNNAPQNAAENCFECPLHGSCIFDAKRLYAGRKNTLGFRGCAKLKWGARTFGVSKNTRAVIGALKSHAKQYARCVWKCDNTVNDVQTVSMEMQNGVYATFTVSAFNESNYRRLELRGTKGEIIADDRGSTILLQRFDKRLKKIRTAPFGALRGHHGGDSGIAKAVMNLHNIPHGDPNYTWIKDTLESHRIAHLAEKSRLGSGV